jgi:hypothetical protein
MSLFDGLKEILRGRVHFYITIGKVPAVEILLRDEEIVAEIKNPLLAMELGIVQLLKSGGKAGGGSMLKKVKSSGYKIKIKYKRFEFEL